MNRQADQMLQGSVREAFLQEELEFRQAPQMPCLHNDRCFLAHQ